jgi:hypothetical protein
MEIWRMRNKFPSSVALQVTKVLSTEEVKRAIEGPGKNFGKSINDPEIESKYRRHNLCLVSMQW